MPKVHGTHHTRLDGLDYVSVAPYDVKTHHMTISVVYSVHPPDDIFGLQLIDIQDTIHDIYFL